jgi:hypothetical protein
MVGFCPQCTVDVCEPGEGYMGCKHENTQSEDEQYFAPTGNGSIKTTVFCKDCNIKMSETWENFT